MVSFPLLSEIRLTPSCLLQVFMSELSLLSSRALVRQHCSATCFSVGWKLYLQNDDSDTEVGKLPNLDHRIKPQP